jgi:phosphoribosyl-AMP cyclohydrolase
MHPGRREGDGIDGRPGLEQGMGSAGFFPPGGEREMEVELPELKFDRDGLIPAIIQDHEKGEVLMLAYMDREALRRTLSSGRTWFWSRSRREYWCKGETSGHRQYVRRIRYDCDGDALLVEVLQVGPACHTGERSCFFREIQGARTDLSPESP